VNGEVDEEKVCEAGIPDRKIRGAKTKITVGFSCQLSFRDGCGQIISEVRLLYCFTTFTFPAVAS